MAENRVIGRDNALPWRLPRDMRRFKALTTGHAVIMGRRTFETLQRPLPHRQNIILTRSRSYHATGAAVVGDLAAALDLAAPDTEAFVAGGAEIYRLALPRADRIYLTVVHGVFEGDAHFPEFGMEAWCLTEDIRFPRDEHHSFPHSFRLYNRRTSGS